MTTTKACVSCGSRTRKLNYPGPRCYSCHSKKKQAASKAAHERMVNKLYGLPAGFYDLIYRLQGSKCAICHRAKGTVRRLAVDHDHSSGYVRGLLCKPCNRMLGHSRDQPEFFRRAAEYLENPPAQQLVYFKKEDT